MTGKDTATKHVLVVEDEPDFAALLQSILEEAGYAVTTAYSGEEAFAEVEETRPDLVTLDIRMPGESGLLFYRKLKRDESLKGIPVVVVTGLTRDDKDMENVIRTFLEPDNFPHPEAYVEKPVDESHLLRAVKELLASRQFA